MILGHAYDVTGSYTSLLTVLALALVITAAMNLFLISSMKETIANVNPGIDVEFLVFKTRI